MLPFVLGGAAILVSRAITSCLEVEEDNERKSRQLERESRRYQRQIEQKRADIAHTKAVNNHQETVKKISAACKAKEKVRENVKKQITSEESFIASLNEQMEQAIEKKAELNRKIKNLPKESEDYIEGKKIVSQYTSFIRKQRNQIKKHQALLDNLQENLLPQLEEQIKELGKKKTAAQQKIKRLNTPKKRRIARYKSEEEDDDEEEEEDEAEEEDDLDPVSKAILSPVVLGAVAVSIPVLGIKKLFDD